MAKSSIRAEGLHARLTDAFREVDRLILTISSGVLAVSVALLGNLPKPADSWAIKASWMFLLAAIVLVLLSLLSEIADKQSRLERIYEGKSEKAGKADQLLSILNVASLIFFGLGLSGVTYFLFQNIH